MDKSSPYCLVYEVWTGWLAYYHRKQKIESPLLNTWAHPDEFGGTEFIFEGFINVSLCLYPASVKVSWRSKELLFSYLGEMAPLLLQPLDSHSCAANMQVQTVTMLYLIQWQTKNSLTLFLSYQVTYSSTYKPCSPSLDQRTTSNWWVDAHANTWMDIDNSVVCLFRDLNAPFYLSPRLFDWRASMPRSPATWWWSQLMAARTRRRVWCWEWTSVLEMGERPRQTDGHAHSLYLKFN